MEFRAQFFAGIFAYLIWSGISLLFIEAVFGRVGAVRGWSKPEMWVLYGTAMILESLCWGLLGPNMFRFANMVRDGSLDLILTRPVPVQFWVSTRYVDLNGVLNALPGFALMLYGLRVVGRWPLFHEWLLWLALLMCGFVMAYSLWFAVVTLSIWVLRLEAANVLIDPVLQAARFPIQIYPARLQGFLIVVLPIAFLTTYPSEALLGRGAAQTLLAAIGMAVLLLWLNTRFFRFALRFYGSASS